jgi:ankyrin repeat protein
MGELTEAAKVGNLARVRQLLDAGGNPDEGSNDVGRPLWWAASSGQTEVARLLLQRGANPHLMTCNLTALQMAKNASHTATAAAIESFLAPPGPVEKWAPMGKTTVAFVGTYPDLEMKLTQVFNFETRERMVLSENLATKAAALGASVSFDDLPAQTVETALAEFTRFGGQADRDFALHGGASLGKGKSLKSELPHG